MQEIIAILSIMTGTVILTAWVMWILFRPGAETRAAKFARDAAKKQLTDGVMRINELENENRQLRDQIEVLKRDYVHPHGGDAGQANASSKSTEQPSGAAGSARQNVVPMKPVGDVQLGRTEESPGSDRVAPAQADTRVATESRRAESQATTEPRQADRSRAAEAAHGTEREAVEPAVSQRQRAAIETLDAAINPADDTDELTDLKRLRGIGPQLEKRLHQLGITRIDQLAEELNNQLKDFPGRAQRRSWPEQARKLLAE